MSDEVIQFLPKMQEMTHFHQRLRFMRKARGMTQQELSNKSGVNVGQITHFECGSRHPCFQNLRAIVIALSCTSDYLLGLSDGGAEDAYRRGAFDAVEAMKKATKSLRVGMFDPQSQERSSL